MVIIDQACRYLCNEWGAVDFMKRRRPNFFIVGAPKCGTTALYHALLDHPQVFLPRSNRTSDYWIHKEPLHFCDDLGIAEWIRIQSEEDYLNLYDNAGDAIRIGDVSALYLFSESAACRIRAFCGDDVRILILLRPPIDWMRSWHHDCIRYAHEPLADFRLALGAGPLRDRGYGLPDHCGFKGCLHYRRMARFSESVARYYEHFGRERVRVILMEDLLAEPARILGEVTEFLGIDPAPFQVIGRQNDSASLSRTHVWEFRMGRKLRSLPLASRLMDWFPRSAVQAYQRTVLHCFPPLSDKSIAPDLRSRLLREFIPEVRRLGELIGRDLSHWNSTGQAPQSPIPVVSHEAVQVPPGAETSSEGGAIGSPVSG